MNSVRHSVTIDSVLLKTGGSILAKLAGAGRCSAVHENLGIGRYIDRQHHAVRGRLRAARGIGIWTGYRGRISITSIAGISIARRSPPAGAAESGVRPGTVAIAGIPAAITATDLASVATTTAAAIPAPAAASPTSKGICILSENRRDQNDQPDLQCMLQHGANSSEVFFRCLPASATITLALPRYSESGKTIRPENCGHCKGIRGELANVRFAEWWVIIAKRPLPIAEDGRLWIRKDSRHHRSVSYAFVDLR